MSNSSVRKPVVFVAPTPRVERLTARMELELRPPVRRGDLDALPDDVSVVGIIDGVFEHSLSVSPREVASCLGRGVRVFGASSMGALRAAEVRGVEGLGRIYRWYRDGVVTGDDEVALVFDPDSWRPMSIPLVNVRFALSCALERGQLPPALGERLLERAIACPYPQRRYELLVRELGLSKQEGAHVVNTLGAYDLKASDAAELLERLAHHELEAPSRVRSAPVRAHHEELAERARPDPRALPYIWESGDEVSPRALFVWFALNARVPIGMVAPSPRASRAQTLEQAFRRIRYRWEWSTPQTLERSLEDLRLEFDELIAALLVAEQGAKRAWKLLGDGDEAAERRVAWIHELACEDLTLKREMLRAGSVEALAARASAQDPALAGARSVVRAKIMARLDAEPWEPLALRLELLGLPPEELESWVETLARARLASAALLRAGEDAHSPARLTPQFTAQRKVYRRFARSPEDALAMAEELAEHLQLTRVGAIEGLIQSEIHISQAFTNVYQWSTSVTGGKGLRPETAYIGAVMEAAELITAAQFEPDVVRRASFSQLRRDAPVRVVDPSELSLPHDSSYTPERVIEWTEVHDLLSGERMWAPAAVFSRARVEQDLLYSPRASRKVISTNGNAAGFSHTEAVLHAVLELVERHEVALWERMHRNPGSDPPLPMRLIDPASLGGSAREAYLRCARMADEVAIVDARVHTAIPTFLAFLRTERNVGEHGLAGLFTGGGVVHVGQASHCCPEDAITSALLEAVQTRASNAAGGREDLLPAARSLGRHERPRTNPRQWRASLFDPDLPRIPLEQLGVASFAADDLREELIAVLERLQRVGLPYVLWADMTPKDMPHARICRTVVPLLSDVNPFSVMPFERLVMLSDWMPRP